MAAEKLIRSNPKQVPPDVYKSILQNFIECYEFDQILDLVMRKTGNEEHVTFSVNAFDILHHDPVIGYTLLHYPKLLLPIFDETVIQAQSNVVKHPAVVAKYGQGGTVKCKCHVRIHSLPLTSELTKASLGQVRSYDADSLLQVSGTIVRTGAVRMLELSKEYQCMNPKCGYRFRVTADPEQGNMLPQPRICPSSVAARRNEDAMGGKQYSCSSTNLRTTEGSRDMVDYQEIKIQDQVERLAMGCVPRSLCVILEANLVDKFNAGDDVTIVGTVVRQWRPVAMGARCSVDIALLANRAEHASNRSMTARDMILRAVCPQLCGMYLVKLALLLTLLGGTSTKESGGVRRRSQSHLLLVGDPGTGKSQLLRFAAAVTARSVLTTGIGTTGAGLTCTAIKDGGDWCLEAGALVLANDGLCCIDEFSSIRETDRASIHEAMEQQTLSVAKAGLVVKLNTRTSVIAVANPKGNYDVTADLSVNTAIASPLLSRFDLVLVLLDTPVKAWDLKLSTFILQQAINEGNSAEVGEGGASGNGAGKMSKEDQVIGAMDWDIDSLRRYITVTKERHQPLLGPEAQCLLVRYYQMQRLASERAVSRTTVRLLEALMRLSEAHAKLMFRNEVLIQDAVVAICLMELSMDCISVLDANSILHSDFPNDADAAYAEAEIRVFSKLSYSRRQLVLDIAQSKHDPETLDAGVDGTPEGGPASLSLTSTLARDRVLESFPGLDVCSLSYQEPGEGERGPDQLDDGANIRAVAGDAKSLGQSQPYWDRSTSAAEVPVNGNEYRCDAGDAVGESDRQHNINQNDFIPGDKIKSEVDSVASIGSMYYNIMHKSTAVSDSGRKRPLVKAEGVKESASSIHDIFRSNEIYIAPNGNNLSNQSHGVSINMRTTLQSTVVSSHNQERNTIRDVSEDEPSSRLPDRQLVQGHADSSWLSRPLPRGFAARPSPPTPTTEAGVRMSQPTSTSNQSLAGPQWSTQLPRSPSPQHCQQQTRGVPLHKWDMSDADRSLAPEPLFSGTLFSSSTLGRTCTVPALPSTGLRTLGVESVLAPTTDMSGSTHDSHPDAMAVTGERKLEVKAVKSASKSFLYSEFVDDW